MKKFILRAIPVLAVLAVILTSTVWPVFAAGIDQVDNMGKGQGISSVNTVAGNIWSTVLTILQIAAVGAVVFAGVKYMFAAAEDKAEIKQGLIGLVVGAILVFGASTIVKFILNIQNEAGLKG